MPNDLLRDEFAGKLAGTLMVVPDVADMLAVSRQRVLQLVRAGRLDATLKGRQWLITAVSVQALIDERRRLTV